MRTSAVHELVHVSGAVTVNAYSRVSASTRVIRSITCALFVVFLHYRLASKFFVSMTSVSPSQWPRESPDH